MTIARSLVAAALLAALAGCLGSSSKPPQFYLLTPRAQPAATAPALTVRVGIGPVRAAPFLKRPQIVTHGGGGDLVIADGHRWSESVEAGIQRVLSQNLNTLTGADVRNFPWTQTTLPQYALRVDVIDLDRGADGNALLEVSWVLEDIAGMKVVDSRRERLTAPIGAGADSYAALTAAYSDLLAQLAQQMAQSLSAKTARQGL